MLPLNKSGGEHNFEDIIARHDGVVQEEHCEEEEVQEEEEQEDSCVDVVDVQEITGDGYEQEYHGGEEQEIDHQP